MTTPNKVVHFEIPADDTARARSFYEKSFAWKMEAYPGMEYTGVMTTPVNDKRETVEAGINGGLAKRGGALMHPVFTIDVPSIDVALASVEKHGGKTVQPKTSIGPMGSIAYFQDSEGNVVGLFQSG